MGRALPLVPLSRSMIWFLGLSILAGVAFTLFPEIDLGLARLFWLPDRGAFMIDDPYGRFVLTTIDRISVYLLLAFYPILLLLTFLARDGVLNRWRRQIAFVVFSGFLGPIVVVNWVLKSHWGRARPRNLEIFGGDQQFTTPFEFADQCATNCSFVSGHAAFAFYFLVFAMLLAGHRRIVAMALIVVLGLAVGLGRMIVGAHFLSDVVFAGVVVYVVGWLVFQAIIVRDGLGYIWSLRSVRWVRGLFARIPGLTTIGASVAGAISKVEAFVLRRREKR